MPIRKANRSGEPIELATLRARYACPRRARGHALRFAACHAQRQSFLLRHRCWPIPSLRNLSGGTLNHCPVGLPNHLVKMPQNIRWRVHCGEVLSLVRLTGAV